MNKCGKNCQIWDKLNVLLAEASVPYDKVFEMDEEMEEESFFRPLAGFEARYRRVIVDAEDCCVRAQDATSDRGWGIHGGVEYSSDGYEE